MTQVNGVRELKIEEIRKKSEFGRVVNVQANTVHDLMADIRFLLSEMERAAEENEQLKRRNKVLELAGDALGRYYREAKEELEQVKKERQLESELAQIEIDGFIKQIGRLREELAAKDKVLDGIANCNPASASIALLSGDGRAILSQYSKGKEQPK